jgi:hypothetical protein
MEMNGPAEHQTPESDMEVEDEFANQEDDLHICKGYVQPEVLPLNQLTTFCKRNWRNGELRK